MDLERLVCDYCWSMPFSVDGFKAIWKSGFLAGSNSEDQAGYTYTTATWQEMQRSINFMCEWCETLCAPPDYYVALSYVWGEKQPNCTTNTTLSSYMEHIDTKLIPKTIRDAIKVTQTLGLRYLWVDAFCIIQDSKEDKAIEISRIRSIFRHAYVTIIAANAERASQGFLNRTILYNTPTTLPFRCLDGKIGTIASPINTCIPDRIFTPDLATLSQISEIEAEKEAVKAWRNMVKLYSQRKLTEPRDRLIALSGIVGYFHDFWRNSRYLAGLWEHQFPSCLLWYVDGGDPAPGPSKYRAPSWSWAAVDGKISFSHGLETMQTCSVEHCYTVLKRQTNPYGEATAGVLVLNVIIRAVIWDPVEGEMFELEGGPAGVSDEDRSERGEIGITTRDAVEEVSRTTNEVYAAVISSWDSTLLGILLVPVDANNTTDDDSLMQLSTYRRVGWFTAPYLDREVWLGTPRERIRIV
ncbi:hypothetical protein PT974_03783 [Cladobotryum mycophilum]|uniref:Heterokaryon incompatibility domain-containing protein n=1 Tax=Cladobotryum mycophilum TaxID=491253 RepID=A0ABR0STA4_9HYPO